jgi:hypothetical protein
VGAAMDVALELLGARLDKNREVRCLGAVKLVQQSATYTIYTRWCVAAAPSARWSDAGSGGEDQPVSHDKCRRAKGNHVGPIDNTWSMSMF